MLLMGLALALGLVLLYFGAEWLVGGSSTVAIRFGMPPLIIGLTLVAFGTSAPELVVSVQGALTGHGDIAIGNVVGSNIFNVAVILGVSALIFPLSVHQDLIRRDMPIMLLSALIAILFLLDGHLGRVEGGMLFAGMVAYVILSIRAARRYPPLPEELVVPAASGSLPRAWTLVALGLATLVLGSHALTWGAVGLARRFGISEAVIGLTIVACGTSLPELATSVVAAFRRQADIAIGNIVGSNIFNALGILGVATLLYPIDGPDVQTFDLWTMGGFSLLLLPLMWSGFRISRGEGALFLALYAGYLYLLWPL
jgi:cation:H+ antiporter